MWSASSSTVISMPDRSAWRDFTWSSRRPGQAITMSTPWRSFWIWGCGETPPKTVTDRRFVAAASGASAASICATSSRVGARMSARGRPGGALGLARCESRHHWQQERVGLAGTGPAAAKDVATRKRIRQGRCLDRERGLDAVGSEYIDNRLRQAEVGESGHG